MGRLTYHRSVKDIEFNFCLCSLLHLLYSRIYLISIIHICFCINLSLGMPEGNCGEGWKKWYPKHWQEEVRFCILFSLFSFFFSFHLFLFASLSCIYIFKRKENMIVKLILEHSYPKIKEGFQGKRRGIDDFYCNVSGFLCIFLLFVYKGL